ncbi:MAG TPA: hypothetical protein VNG51_13705 [Ktedonobacteraceae bacterium]|nr:hypothetical protein [Ktedonobacteraceae bacterium]
MTFATALALSPKTIDKKRLDCYADADKDDNEQQRTGQVAFARQ